MYICINVYLYICIYVWKNRMTIFGSLWVLPIMDDFFLQLRILVFDFEGMFKSFDNTGFRHPPTVSKRRPKWSKLGAVTGYPNFVFMAFQVHV